MSRRVVCFAVALALCGCDEAFQNRSTREMQNAESKEKQGDYNAAVQSYEAALDGSPKDADVHFRLAMIYDEKIKDPVSATHHFQRYLALAPHGPHAKDVRKFIEDDETKIIASLSKDAFMTQSDAVRLKNDNLDLRKQLTDLRAQRTTTAQSTAGIEPPRSIPRGSRTYTVKHGDTLVSISRRYFKTSAHARDILDANYNTLKGRTNLQPGMTLIIPDK